MSIRIIGMDIPTQLENLLKQQEKNAKETVFAEDMAAYRKGVEDSLVMLRELLAPIGEDYIIQFKDMGDKQVAIPLKDIADTLNTVSTLDKLISSLESVSTAMATSYEDFVNKYEEGEVSDE